MSAYKNIAIVGASGNLGGPITTALLSTSKFHITALARSTSTSTFPPSITVKKGDLTSPTFLASALQNIDALVLATTTSALDSQKVIIDAAAKAGVKRIVPSEFGSDTTNPVIVEVIPFFQSKVDVLEYLKGVSKETAGLSWTGIVNGPFYDWCLGGGVLGFDNAAHKATLYDNGTAKFSTTTLPRIGEAIAALLTHPDKYVNEFLFVNSFTTSQAEILAALKKASGAEWEVEHKDAGARIADGKEKLANGDPHGALDLIFGATFHGGYGGDYSAKVNSQALGLEAQDLETVTREVYEAVVDKH